MSSLACWDCDAFLLMCAVAVSASVPSGWSLASRASVMTLVLRWLWSASRADLTAARASSSRANRGRHRLPPRPPTTRGHLSSVPSFAVHSLSWFLCSVHVTEIIIGSSVFGFVVLIFRVVGKSVNKNSSYQKWNYVFQMPVCWLCMLWLKMFTCWLSIGCDEKCAQTSYRICHLSVCSVKFSFYIGIFQKEHKFFYNPLTVFSADLTAFRNTWYFCFIKTGYRSHK